MPFLDKGTREKYKQKNSVDYHYNYMGWYLCFSLVPREICLSFIKPLNQIVLLPVILQAEIAAAFISNHFPLSYPGKGSEDVGFFKYSAGKKQKQKIKNKTKKELQCVTHR